MSKDKVMNDYKQKTKKLKNIGKNKPYIFKL